MEGRRSVTLKLTKKQRLFCEAYVKSGNGTQAALAAGYPEAAARSVASENLTKPNIKGYLAELTAGPLAEARQSAEMGAGELVERLTTIGRFPVVDPNPKVILGALQTLVKVRGLEKQPDDRRGLTVNVEKLLVLAAGSGGKLSDAYRAALVGANG